MEIETLWIDLIIFSINYSCNIFHDNLDATQEYVECCFHINISPRSYGRIY